MNFRPSKIKMIVSIIVILIWYIFLFWNASNTRLKCPPPNFPCANTIDLYLIPHAGCDCIKTSSGPGLFIFIELLFLLFPGILMYIIWSLLEKKKLNSPTKFS